MSEEQPTFKITDRRLFNADGSPREDAVRDKEAAAPEKPDSISSETRPARDEAMTAEISAARESAQRPQAATAANDPRPAAGASRQEEATEDAPGGDPAFINLVMFIASPAAAALGFTEHPGLGAGEVDLELAKHCIDLLGALQQKTRGNLSLEERQTLDGLLTELRMQYLSLTGGVSAPAMGVGSRRRGGGSAGGGFTGNDITGGR